MKRNLMKALKAWKNKSNKHPMLLLGARQVGKTYLLKEFGTLHYEKMVYINFESDSKWAKLFEQNLNPKRIISEIEIILGYKIETNKMLIFFDEIQIEHRAITALKYFDEEVPGLDIVCAGSLVGAAINHEKFSFPVGKVEFQYLYPFSFDEFLMGIGEELLVGAIIDSYHNDREIIEPIHKKALELYRRYLYVGGMPAAILHYKQIGQDIIDFDHNVHQNIINAYIVDMSKYATATEAVKAQSIYRSIPDQMAGGYKKFKYSLVKKGAKASNFGSSIEWLLLSKLAIDVRLINWVDFPLKAFSDSKYFKLFFSDVGLLMTLSKMPYKILKENEGNHLFKGALTENFVAMELKANELQLYYWKDKAYEVDFVIQVEDLIVPVEVKASTNKRSRSLKEYIRKYKPELSIRISMHNFGIVDGIKSVPLYATFMIGRK